MIEQRTTRITKFRVVPWEDVLWPSNGLVSWWKLNGNANDAWGSNHGTAYGVSWFPRGAGSFDGVDDYIKVTDSPDFDFTATDQFTYELFVKANRATHNDFEEYGIHQGNQFYLAWGHDNIAYGPGAAFYGDDLAWHPVKFSKSLSAGQWYHIVATYDKSEFRVYVNGELDNSVSYTYGVNDGGDLNIGGQKTYNNFSGLIDEVRIYDRALSADEIKKRYLKTRIVPLEVGV